MDFTQICFTVLGKFVQLWWRSYFDEKNDLVCMFTVKTLSRVSFGCIFHPCLSVFAPSEYVRYRLHLIYC